MSMKTGIRVVRGPDWSSGAQDGGEGYLGTVVSIPEKGPGHGKVSVIWDISGEERMYCAGRDNRFEIRIFDNGPIGVVHKSVTCDACKTEGIAGMRWKCVVCTDFDLCTPCYNADRHDRGHAFLRYVTSDGKLVRLPPRNASLRKEVFGLVKGADVVRGPHWHFQDQDGGQGSVGKILEVGTFTGGYYRGGVRVRWPSKPDNLVGYKVGAEGRVNLMAVSKTSGGYYYPDHLPALDVLNPDQIHLNRGDKVKVDIDVDTFRKLQKEHSVGWNDGMQQCINEVGTIVGIPHPSVMRLQFEDARVWVVLRHVLTRLSSFKKGDKVRIIDSYNAAVELQVGHGGWNDKMEECLGKIGEIIDIDGDGDLRVQINGKKWLLSPVSCSLHFERNQQATQITNQQQITIKEPELKTSVSSSSIKERIVIIKRQLSSVTLNEKEYITAAHDGDLEKIKSFIGSFPSQIDVRVKGYTALHLASNKGHLQVVSFLIQNGADKDACDETGDSVLHYAIDGEQDSIVEELCKQGANKNAKNKNGFTPLHLAVDQRVADCVRILVNNGADVNVQDNDGDTPLHLIMRQDESVHDADDKKPKRKKEIIRCLLNCDKLDGSKKNKDGLNVLHQAVISDEQRVTEVLIDRNKELASVIGGAHNWTPLHIAAMNGRTAIAGMLIRKCSVKIDPRDKEKRTPLHLAVQVCSSTILDLLLCQGADPNAQDKDGNTPAHLTLMPKLSIVPEEKVEEERMVQTILCMLAESGANLNLKNNAGKTPLQLCNIPELVDKLKRIMEKVTGKNQDNIPPHWAPMDLQELIVQELKANDPLTAEEYKNVSYKFLKTMANVEIVSIKRIQNRAMWDAYTVSKRTLERKYGIGCANELSLFHGTPAEAVEPILHQNIDPLLAGAKTGAIWGKGAYFAVDAKTSDNYTQADDNGHRFIFMARVLAGKVSQGEKSLQRPPPLDAKKPNELADAVVDNPTAPRIYVVFRNQQIYPEFLIQYE